MARPIAIALLIVLLATTVGCTDSSDADEATPDGAASSVAVTSTVSAEVTAAASGAAPATAGAADPAAAAAEAAAIERELDAIQRELDALSLPSDADFQAIEDALD